MPQEPPNSLSDGVPERRQFSGAAFGGVQIVLQLYVKQLLKLEKAGRFFQSGNVVGNPNSFGSVSVKRQYGPDQPVVSPALSTPHGASHADVPNVALAYNDVIDHVPVF